MSALRLTSWYEMYELHAKRFLDAISDIERIDLICAEHSDAQFFRMDGETRERAGNLCAQLHGMGLAVSVKAAERLCEITANPEATPAQIQSTVRDVRSRMDDELGSRFWLHLDNEEAEHYEASVNLFDEHVIKKWPKMGSDVDEVGKCFATARYTASVFHLMRIMEIALRKMGGAVGATIKEKDGWLIILETRLEPAINALPNNTVAEKQRKQALQQTRAHLHAVRLAWRNDTMHPKMTYTKEEARELIGHVRTFLQSLAGLI